MAKDSRPVAGYFRISKARDDMRAPDIYRQEIKKWGRYKGTTVAKIFHDIDFSGRRGSKPRPGLEELKERRHEFSAVVTPKLSRLGRSQKELLELFDLFDSDGIGLVFLDLDVDTRTSSGKFMRSVMAAIAEFESDRLSESWKATLAFVRSEGRPTGGIPYGYRYDKEAKTYRVDRRKANVVRDIYRRFVAGESLHSITNDLNRRGVQPSKVATRWARNTVADLLEKPSYVSMLPDGSSGNWPSIVDQEVWKKASARRRHQRETHKARPPGNPRYLLTGIIKCGRCGGGMVHHASHTTRPSLYQCPGCGLGIASHRAEEPVIEAFLEKVSEPFKKVAMTVPRKAFPKTETDLFVRRRADIVRKIERVVDASEAATTPTALKAFQKKLAGLEEELRAADEEADAQTARGIETDRKVADLNELRKRLANLPDVWSRIEVEEKREALQLFIESVVVLPDTRPRQLSLSWVAGL